MCGDALGWAAWAAQTAGAVSKAEVRCDLPQATRPRRESECRHVRLRLQRCRGTRHQLDEGTPTWYDGSGLAGMPTSCNVHPRASIGFPGQQAALQTSNPEQEDYLYDSLMSSSSTKSTLMHVQQSDICQPGQVPQAPMPF